MHYMHHDLYFMPSVSPSVNSILDADFAVLTYIMSHIRDIFFMWLILCDCSLKDIFHERAWLKSDIFSVQVSVNCENVYSVCITSYSVPGAGITQLLYSTCIIQTTTRLRATDNNEGYNGRTTRSVAPLPECRHYSITIRHRLLIFRHF